VGNWPAWYSHNPASEKYTSKPVITITTRIASSTWIIIVTFLPATLLLVKREGGREHTKTCMIFACLGSLEKSTKGGAGVRAGTKSSYFVSLDDAMKALG